MEPAAPPGLHVAGDVRRAQSADVQVRPEELQDSGQVAGVAVPGGFLLFRP
jgi:hypothetical protein